MELTDNVEARAFNGQCEYGEWLPVGSDDLPWWVGALIGDEIAETGAEEGTVSQGGMSYRWRKGGAK